MTEKEKAKAYDKAIERAKKLYGNVITEEIFSELKESYDEKIRRWVIDDIRYNMNNEPLNNSEYKKKAEKAIDWLEKQCEPNPYSGVSFKYNGHTWGMCGRDGGVEILVDGKIKERILLYNKPKGKSALEAIKEEQVDNELVSLCSE